MGTEWYAYQIALKTLKERCSSLQTKLDVVEEENYQLKLQLSQDIVRKSPRSLHDVAQLNEQVVLLTEQKSQLKNQVEIVTTENHKLWTRLSKLTSSENYDSKSSIRDDTLLCLNENVSYSDNHSDLEISKMVMSPDYNSESLEEISLKLNGTLSDKRELHSPHFLEFKGNTSSLQLENFAFSSSDDNIVNSINNHIMKLKQFKQILNNTKNDLASGIATFKNFKKKNSCSKCNNAFPVKCELNVIGAKNVVDPSDLSTLQVGDASDLNEELSKTPDKICPLCAATFAGSFEEFHRHVSDHFLDDDPLNLPDELVP